MNEHVDLFSGLGSWAIAARANGIRTVAFCEREEWLAAGLERIWRVPCHRAIETFPAQDYAGRVWLLTGSPPCQPASLAGKRRGAADDRWLWPQTVEVCEVIQPAWFVFENVIGLDGVGLDGIISDLERLGYETATLRIPACAVDSAQDRDRFWIVGNAESSQWRANTERRRCDEQWRNGERQATSRFAQPTQSSTLVERDGEWRQRPEPAAGGAVANGEKCKGRLSIQPRRPQQASAESSRSIDGGHCEWITFDDRLYRVPVGLHELAVQFAAGIPKKLRGRLISALGNAIHWQVASEIIGAIVKSEGMPNNAKSHE